jgi:RHS repeat-associated protein
VEDSKDGRPLSQDLCQFAVDNGWPISLLTLKTAGATVNYSLSSGSAYDSTDFSHSSFTGAPSGSTLSGGTAGGGSPVYDSGTVTLTINGTAKAVSYGNGDTATSIASKLATAFAGNASVSVAASGANLSVSAKGTGSTTNYAYTFSDTYNSGTFSAPSFTGSPATGSLTGGSNGRSTSTNVYSYNIGSSGYQANGNVQSFTDSVMGSWSYQYDTLNRVTGGVASTGPNSGSSDCFTYDNFGNRKVEAFSTTPCRGTLNTTTWATYDTNNRFTGTTYKTVMAVGNGYDLAGNITDDGINKYAYDNEERVCAVQNSVGAIQYVYDASGNRIAKGNITAFNCNIASNGFALTAAYVVDHAGQQVTEFNGSGTWQYSNVYAGGKLLATYTPPMTLFHFNDWLGTMRVTTNADGSQSNCWTSLVFGNNYAPCNPSVSDTPDLHYTGKEHDVESGNDYFGARFMANRMGRFMSPDWSVKPKDVPYSDLHDPQSLNLYADVRNNPLTQVDGMDTSLQMSTARKVGTIARGRLTTLSEWT